MIQDSADYHIDAHLDLGMDLLEELMQNNKFGQSMADSLERVMVIMKYSQVGMIFFVLYLQDFFTKNSQVLHTFEGNTTTFLNEIVPNQVLEPFDSEGLNYDLRRLDSVASCQDWDGKDCTGYFRQIITNRYIMCIFQKKKINSSTSGGSVIPTIQLTHQNTSRKATT